VQLLEIKLPQLAESVVTATISKWLKQPGDQVQEYEPICEIITDKVTAEIPCAASGTIRELLAEEGREIEAGTVICLLETDAPDAKAEEHTVPVPQSAAEKSGAGIYTPRDKSEKRRYSPAVRKLAGEHRLDLEKIRGTGLGGRITRKDVLNVLANRQKAGDVPAANDLMDDPLDVPVRSTGLHLTPAHAPQLDLEEAEQAGRNEYFINVTPIRHTIASRMRQSVTEIPHAWTMIEVDVTNLVLLRNKIKQEFMEREGVNLTYLAFVIKAVVNAIKDYPILNSVWAVDKIIVKKDINISLAVGTEEAVFVPVIKNADQKNIAGLAKEIDALTKKARAGKLTPQDMQGGTFTVNNTGAFGAILSYPIINYPQAATLTFEAIVKRPVVIDDMIAVRSMVNMALSLDHRILDGVICGRFLQRVKENLESFGPDTKLY
jgi:2-oxoisovalerate dehydrogenase E2 component (dihydrolipoyl transacylase)